MLERDRNINCCSSFERRREPVRWNNFDETNRILRSKSKFAKRLSIISGPNRENMTAKFL